MLVTSRIEEVSGIRPVTLLIACGIALIIGIFAVTGIAAGHLHKQAIKTTESDLSQIDGILAVATQNALLAEDARLAVVAQRLDTMTANPVQVGRELAGQPAVAALLREQLNSASSGSPLALISPDGSVIASAGPWPGDIPADRLIALLHEHPGASRVVGPAISDPKTGRVWVPIAHRTAHTMATPSAAVVALLPVTKLTTLFAAAALPPDAAVSLLNPDGSIIVRYPEHQMRHPGGHAARTPVAAILGNMTAAMIRHSRGNNGNWQIEAVHPLSDYPIAVTVSRDVNQVLAGWAYQGLAYAAFALGGALAVGVMVFLIARQFQTHATLAKMHAERIDAERIESERARLAAEAELLKGERLAVLGNLTATVAHELRNPLSAIRNTIFTIKEVAAASGGKFDRPIGRMERSIERCDKIISDLLEYARTRDLKRTDVPFDHWVAETLAELPVPAPVVVTTELAAPDEVISLDRDRFQRVIINLVENAAQALAEVTTEREKRIVVRSETTDHELLLTIEDNGPGIKPENLEHIFQPLFSTKSFGTGLGLPTVKHIVDQHGGIIAVDSVVGSGTRVMVRLPLQREKTDMKVAA